MTTAAEPEQQTPEDAARPTLGGAPGGLASGSLSLIPGDLASGGLSLLPGLDAGDAGLCIGGVCRLPGAKD